MADKVVALEASDVLALASNFIPQNSNIRSDQSTAQMIKANGDIQKYASVFNEIDNVSISYRWNADEGLGAALEALCGSLENSYIITAVRIETVFNYWPTITFTAHNHADNAHAAVPALPTFSIPADMIAILTGAFGAYDFFAKAADNVCIQRSTYELRCEHVDAECSTGDHWVGTNIRGVEECTCEYISNVATPSTVSGWTVTSYEVNDSNEEHDTSSITAERAVDRD